VCSSDLFLDFDSKKENSAILLNNYDWMSKFSIIDFSRNIGKHITINYMMAKDSVKKRIGKESDDGMSFTEFTYQLVQGYDFLYLFQNMNCTIQMGGSDQWGNITTGTELIRRKENKKAFALTCPLVTKSDGSKFGKSESGNVWLDKKKTSAYKFYQYWINVSDEDAQNYIKIFTFLTQKEIDVIITEHNKNKGLRVLQNHLANSLTKLIHGEKELENAVNASKILFGKSSEDDLRSIDSDTIMEIFEGLPKSNLSLKKLNDGIQIEMFLSKETNFLKSLSEAKRALNENSIYVNKNKVSNNFIISDKDLINKKFILLQRGRKNYFLVNVN
jgi:tyrosyl-tRNA synthetase